MKRSCAAVRLWDRWVCVWIRIVLSVVLNRIVKLLQGLLFAIERLECRLLMLEALNERGCC